MEQQWPTTTRRVWQVRDGELQEQETQIVLEEPLSLFVNGQQVAVLMRLPGMEKELAAGFSISEGLVADFADVLTIRHCGRGLPALDEGVLEEGAEATGDESRNEVEVQVRPGGLRPEARLEVVRLIRAGCGAVDVDRAELPLSPVQNDLTVDTQVVLRLAQTMAAAQDLHRHVGGVHAAALFDAQGKLVILCEDVGRHNAVDKAVGYCLLRGIPLADKLLLCSGRLSYEMVTKAIRVGLPILLSMSAPTALGVQFADRFGLTIAGYLRGSRMTVYTHPRRLGLGQPTA